MCNGVYQDNMRQRSPKFFRGFWAFFRVIEFLRKNVQRSFVKWKTIKIKAD